MLRLMYNHVIAWFRSEFRVWGCGGYTESCNNIARCVWHGMDGDIKNGWKWMNDKRTNDLNCLSFLTDESRIRNAYFDLMLPDRKYPEYTVSRQKVSRSANRINPKILVSSFYFSVPLANRVPLSGLGSTIGIARACSDHSPPSTGE